MTPLGRVLFAELGQPARLDERMTFDQLMAYSDPKRIARSATVKVPPLHFDMFKDSESYYFNVKSHPSTTGLRHHGVIKVYKPKNPNTPLEKCECEVDCECPDYRYRWAFANKQRGSSRVGPRSLNQAWNKAPRRTNPTGRPGLCIAEGELISTKRGFIPIESVVVGDFVWTLSGWNKVTAASKTGVKDVVTVETAAGRKMRLTPEHLVYAFDSKCGFSWIKACDLRDTHYACTALPHDNEAEYEKTFITNKTGRVAPNRKQYTEREIVLDETLAELTGYMVSEGTRREFCNTNNELLADFVKKWESKFGCSVTASEDRVTVGEQGGDILESLGCKFGSYNKITPPWIMRARRSVITAYLRGCYAGDGCFEKQLSCYASVSERLAREIFLLLSQLGVRASIRNYAGGINDSSTWFVRTTSSVETRKLFKLIDPIRGYSTQPMTVGSEGMHDHILDDQKRLFKNLIREDLEKESAMQDETIATIDAAIKQFGILNRDAAVELLKRIGVDPVKVRLRSFGKPHNAAAVKDLARASLDYRAAQLTLKLDLKKAKGSKRSRFEIAGEIEKIRDIAPGAFAQLKTLVREDINFERVETVDPDKSGPVSVYDLTVESAEHFTVNGIIVHNCKHISAIRNFIYGQLGKFASERDTSTVSKLDRIVKSAEKRWQDYSAHTDKAKERDREIKASIQRLAQKKADALKTGVPLEIPVAGAPKPAAKPAAPPPAAKPVQRAVTVQDLERQMSPSYYGGRLGDSVRVVNGMNILEEVDALIAKNITPAKNQPAGGKLADKDKSGGPSDNNDEFMDTLREIRDIVRHLAGEDLPPDMAAADADESDKIEEPGIPVEATVARKEN